MVKQDNEGQDTYRAAHRAACSTRLRRGKRLRSPAGEGKREEAGGSQGQRQRTVVRRYHGRLQGRGLLGWAYETVFVVALWLRQENRWFSSSCVTKAMQVRLPDLPCPLA